MDKIKNLIKSPKFKKWIHKGESGSIAVFFAILFPVLMTTILFFENRMEVRYVTNETQAIMDLSTTGAATTGIVYQTNSAKPFCSIPYQDSRHTDGATVAKNLLKTNTKNLPVNARNAILKEMNTGKIQGLDDAEEYNGGYARMSIKFSFSPRTHLFFNKYTIKLKSSATCYPDPNISLASANANQTYVFDALVDAGYSPQAAAGIIGSLVGESGMNLDPSIVESNGQGFGIAQWSFGRKTQVKAWLKNHGYSETSLEGQTEFMIQELDQYGIGDLKTSDDVEAVVRWHVNNYERPLQSLRPARIVLGVNTANSILKTHAN